MLTLFTTAKPFRGHTAVIQRNALKSWTLLHPDVEVILFGDDEGAAEVCAGLGLRHEPYVERHESGTKYINYVFARAQQISRNQYFCFSNCDIILLSDFWRAFEKIRLWRDRFLLVARRWDTDITEPINFGRRDWDDRLRQFARAHGFRQKANWIDFFLFSKGQYLDMPSLIVGHCFWDGWVIWKALSEGVPVVDASPCVFAVHQNHGYAARFGRIKGLGVDTLSQINRERIAGIRRLRNISDARYRLTSAGIRRNWISYIGPAARRYSPLVVNKVHWVLQTYLWHPVLNLTRPARQVLGLRKAGARPARKP
jgi:hypothetical protein